MHLHRQLHFIEAFVIKRLRVCFGLDWVLVKIGPKFRFRDLCTEGLAIRPVRDIRGYIRRTKLSTAAGSPLRGSPTKKTLPLGPIITTVGTLVMGKGSGAKDVSG